MMSFVGGRVMILLGFLVLALSFRSPIPRIAGGISQYRSGLEVDDVEECTIPERKNSKRVSIASVTVAMPLMLIFAVTADAHAASIVTQTSDMTFLSPKVIFNLVAGKWRYFGAGAICCALSHAFTLPFDVVKTRIQADPNGDNNPINIFREEGPSALFTGAASSIIGYGVAGSQKYGFYEVLKPLVSDFIQQFQTVDSSFALATSSTVVFIVAGAIAETLACLVLAPFEATKIRLVSCPGYATGLVSCTQKMVKEEGLGSLYNGLLPLLVKQVPYTMVQFSVFETIIASVYSDPSYGEFLRQYPFLTTASAAVIAGILSSLVSQPGDTLLTAVYKKNGPGCLIDEEGAFPNTPVSTLSAFKQAFVSVNGTVSGIQIPVTTTATPGKVESLAEPSTLQIMINEAQEMGMRGLFVGTQARLYYVTTLVLVQLSAYDEVKRLCGIIPGALGGH